MPFALLSDLPFQLNSPMLLFSDVLGKLPIFLPHFSYFGRGLVISALFGWSLFELALFDLLEEILNEPVAFFSVGFFRRAVKFIRGERSYFLFLSFVKGFLLHSPFILEISNLHIDCILSDLLKNIIYLRSTVVVINLFGLLYVIPDFSSLLSFFFELFVDLLKLRGSVVR